MSLLWPCPRNARHNAGLRIDPMNNTRADGTPGASAVGIPSSNGPSTLEGEPVVTPASSAPRAPMGVRILRLVVLIGVVFVTVGLLLFAGTWLVYRAEHTVVGNAMVMGRVHRIGARIDGQIKSVEVQPGQHVFKGQVLIGLEDAHLRAAVLEAQSELAAAQKRYDAERLAIEHERRRLPLEVERCESVCRAAAGEVEAAVSNQEKQEREFTRINSLVKSGIASSSDLDRVQAERDNARALLKAAQANLAADESTCRVARVQVDGLRVREAGLDVFAAELEGARQHLSLANAELAASVIRAPEDGWVAERIVEPGGSAKVGEPMLTLWVGVPWIEAWADEKKLAHIAIDSPVDVTLTAYPGRQFQGRVESIGVLADRQLQAETVPSTLHSLFPPNAIVPIRIAVSMDQFRIQPGLTALVGIQDAEEGPLSQKGWIGPLLSRVRATLFPAETITK
jgi:membrane fusion protein, multidrug efflux system